ncbi:MAG TPA: DUF393 domain-containing protein [Solirubrobacteraceae bacterium]|nr:DUF393 domain-containing protein [Solirubrobacteraceae bacterium]
MPAALPAERSRAHRPRAERAFVLYDGDCGLCTWLLAGLLRLDRAERLHPIALQRPEADELLADLAPAERLDSWHLISEAGVRFSAGAALVPLLELLPRGHALAAPFARLPGITERCYRWTAQHRTQLSRLLGSGAKRRAGERVRRRERALESPMQPPPGGED